MSPAYTKDSVVLKKAENLFHKYNQQYFKGIVPVPEFRLSRRMRRAAKFWMRRYKSSGKTVYEAEITLSVPYHEKYGWDSELSDSIKHEMVHMFLFRRGRPAGHTKVFKEICRTIGTNVYSKDHSRAYKYVFQCPSCGQEYKRMKWVTESCKKCSVGKCNAKFELKLKEML